MGRLVATGPTTNWSDGQHEQPEGGHSRNPLVAAAAAAVCDVRQLSRPPRLSANNDQLERSDSVSQMGL